ncbi:MAG: anthranilate synthase component I, partial [Pseudomonadota bacterium]
MTESSHTTALPENAASASAALRSGRPALVWRKTIADSETPVGAARRLIKSGRGDFLLESVEGGEVRARYSMLGLDPDLVFRASETSAEINPAWRDDRAAFRACAGDAMAELRALASSCLIDLPEGLPTPALPCLVGYFGYETIGLVETLPRAEGSDLQLPDMLFVRPTIILVFDELTDDLFCITPIWEADDPDAAIEMAAERIDETLRALSGQLPPEPRLAGFDAEPELAPVMPGIPHQASPEP